MFDFLRYEEKARAMTADDLYYAILDCAEAAEVMDALDREDGLDRAGRYRDEASVYRQEWARRQGDVR